MEKLTCDWRRAWQAYHVFDRRVDINLICVISIVMRGQIVSLFVTCKIDWVASKNMQNFIILACQTTKRRLIFCDSLKRLERHHSSRQNLGIEDLIRIIQNDSKSVW